MFDVSISSLLEKYEYKYQFKKVNNVTATTGRAFDYITSGENNACSLIAWQIGPFWQDTLAMCDSLGSGVWTMKFGLQTRVVKHS